MKYDNTEDVKVLPEGTEDADIDYIKSILFIKDEHQIKPFQHITLEAIDVLKQGEKAKRNRCFMKFTKSETDFFYVDVRCSDCDKKMTLRMSKTKMLEHIDGKHSFCCNDCKKAAEERWRIWEESHREQKEAERQEAERKYKEKLCKNTKDFINEYLDPDKKWPSGTSRKDMVYPIIYPDNHLDHDVIAEHIKGMPYQDFLKTKYWQAVSAHAKYKTDYSCQLCGTQSYTLNTHHKNYKRHGYEHLSHVMKEDLIVLCQNCHSKFHDKLAN